MPNGASARATAVTLTTTANTSVLSVADSYAGVGSTIQAVAGTGENIVISGVANVTAGTGTTAVNVKCVDQSSAQIGTTQVHTLAAGASGNIPICFADTRGQLGQNTYTIQLQQVAATANGTVNEIVCWTQTQG